MNFLTRSSTPPGRPWPATRRLRRRILGAGIATLLGLCAAPRHARAQIYVTNFSGNTAGAYNATTGTPINASLVTGLSSPVGIAVSGNNLFVTNFSGNTVGAYNATTGAAINASLVTGLNGPTGLAFSANNLFVANDGGNTVGTYNAATGAAINAGLVTGLSGPIGIVVSGNNLFVANQGSKTVGAYNATTGAAINASLVTGLNGLEGIAVSGNNLFVASFSSNTVGEYNTTTGAAINGSFVTVNSPTGIAVSGNNLFVANFIGNTVGEYDATTGALINASFITGLNNPYLIATLPSVIPIFTGPLLQNSAPASIPTTADFLVIGPVQTGGPSENNTVNTLTFLPGSSLHIYNNLTVTLGPVILPGGATITLDGSLTVNQLRMLEGSLLTGNGSILGDLINGGVLSPGHSPGQITVNGNYTQTPTGALTIQLGGIGTAQHDLLTVGGTATLSGTLQLVQLNGFKFKRNQSITFLTATGGVNGTFANVASDFTNNTTILQPTVVYGSNSVALEAVQGSFKTFAQNWNLTPNEQSVGGMLDSAANDRRANTLFDYLDYRTLDKLPADLAKISPDALTSIFTISTALAQVQSQNLQRRTDDLRSGASGFNAANLALNGDGPSFSGTVPFRAGMAGPNGDDGKEMKETKEVAPTETRWGAFLSGTGEWVSVGDTNNARGYELESGGFTLGVDYKVCPNFAIGLMAGYTGTTSDLANGGRIFVNGGNIGLYATTFVGGWYADVAAFGGYNSYDTRRSALQGDARGSADGGEVNALFGTGYDFKKGGLTFGPTATFNYTYAGLSGFNESGSLAPLSIHGGSGESLRSAFGVKVSYDWKVGGIVIKPELRAAWQHEYGDSAYAIDSSLASGAGGTFTVHGPRLGRDSALLGAGFAIQCSERCSTYFYYDGELGRTNYQSSSVTGGVRIAF